MFRFLTHESRVAEIVRVWDEHIAARERAAEASGPREVERIHAALNDRRQDLWTRIAATPARTVEGMLAKVACVAPLFDASDREGDGNVEHILASVAVDYREAAGGKTAAL